MLVLEWKGQTTIPVEAECLRPDLLWQKSVDEVAELPVQHGNRSEPAGEFFTISGSPGDKRLRLVGDFHRVKWIGAEMSEGLIEIEGDAGMHLGSGMSGGRIHVNGNVGGWVGAEMRGGIIHVTGDAEHQVGAAYRGSHRGMRGGTILVEGSAGNEIGATMRRGLIAIGGSAGDFVGGAMIAGTVFVFGDVGLRTGAGMKRGTISLFGEQSPSILPTFRLAASFAPQFQRIFLSQLTRHGFPVPENSRSAEAHRYCGDLVALGKGEILHCTS